MGKAFINSLIVTIPSTVIPITIAAFAAYAFAWIPFRGRGILFTIVVALLVVPLQMSLIPILQIYSGVGAVRHVPGHLAGAHGLRPAAGDLPALQLHLAAAARPVRVGRRSMARRTSRRSSGSSCRCRSRPSARSRSSSSCGSGTTSWWRWSSWARARTFASCRPRSSTCIGSRGGSWHLLTAGAFVTMVVPLRRLPAAPAGVRARDPGRLRQVVTLGAAHDRLRRHRAAGDRRRGGSANAASPA